MFSIRLGVEGFRAFRLRNSGSGFRVQGFRVASRLWTEGHRKGALYLGVHCARCRKVDFVARQGDEGVSIWARPKTLNHEPV